MKVCKFGGTSVANATQIKKVVNILRLDNTRRIIVVSAPGKRTVDDTKITDDFIQLYNAVLNHDDSTIEKKIVTIIFRFKEIENELGVKKIISSTFEEYLKELIRQNKHQPAYLLDALKSCGEDFNAMIIAAYIDETYQSAKYISPKDIGLKVSDEPGHAMVLKESYSNIKQTLKNENDIIVIPGFFGYNDQKAITFSRGGSDLTGAIIASAVHASAYENFTDVSGIYRVNPTMVKDPEIIDALTYDEMRELSYAGFNVFHDEAVAPLVSSNIPIIIKNTNAPNDPGTKIMQKRVQTGVTAVTSDAGFTSINMKKYLMNREIGFTRKLLSILEDMNISYEHSPSGIDHVSIVLRSTELEGKENTLLTKIKEQLNVTKITVEKNLVLIMIVGEGMKTAIGTASKATTALSNEHINLKMINQGSSEISIMFGIDSKDERTAIQAIYDAFFNEIKRR